MAIIKKPIKKTLFLLSSLLGIIFTLHNLSQLEAKAKNLFGANLISSARADVPGESGGGGGGDDGDSPSGGGCNGGSSCVSGPGDTAGDPAGNSAGVGGMGGPAGAVGGT